MRERGGPNYEQYCIKAMGPRYMKTIIGKPYGIPPKLTFTSKDCGKRGDNNPWLQENGCHFFVAHHLTNDTKKTSEG